MLRLSVLIAGSVLERSMISAFASSVLRCSAAATSLCVTALQTAPHARKPDGIANKKVRSLRRMQNVSLGCSSRICQGPSAVATNRQCKGRSTAFECSPRIPRSSNSEWSTTFSSFSMTLMSTRAGRPVQSIQIIRSAIQTVGGAATDRGGEQRLSAAYVEGPANRRSHSAAGVMTSSRS